MKEILGGAPEDYRGERWAIGDYSGRIGEEAHFTICPREIYRGYFFGGHSG